MDAIPRNSQFPARTGWLVLSTCSPLGEKGPVGVKIRGVFETESRAEKHRQQLQMDDREFDFFVMTTDGWIELPPDLEAAEVLEFRDPNAKAIRDMERETRSGPSDGSSKLSECFTPVSGANECAKSWAEEMTELDERIECERQSMGLMATAEQEKQEVMLPFGSTSNHRETKIHVPDVLPWGMDAHRIDGQSVAIVSCACPGGMQCVREKGLLMRVWGVYGSTEEAIAMCGQNDDFPFALIRVPMFEFFKMPPNEFVTNRVAGEMYLQPESVSSLMDLEVSRRKEEARKREDRIRCAKALVNKRNEYSAILQRKNAEV